MQYVKVKVEDWVNYINTFTGIMPNNPQAAFAGYTRSLQFEWAYIQRTIEVEERVFEPFKDASNKMLLPALFKVSSISADLQDLTSIPARMGGLGALYSCHEAPGNMATSKDSTSHLVDAILGCIKFDPQEHVAAMEAGRASGKK
eukprot:10139795-Ditylum_brightwellii.AAC.1